MNSKVIEKKDRRIFSLGGNVMRQLFKFLASLQLAVGTLVTLMIVLAAGTVVESRYSADAARILIYGAPWFSLILIVLVINLACSAADRLPWKKKHIGFVLTHLGIIIILAGSMATQQSAVDGQMSLEEGSTGKWVTLKQPMFYLYSQAFKEERMIPFKERAFRWKGHEKITELKAEGRFAEIALTQFYPKANAESKWAPASQGPLALQVTIHNAMMNVTQWLADEPMSREVSVGPAVFKLASELMQPSPEISDKSYFEIKRGEEKLQMPAPEKNALPFEKVFDNGLKIKVLELYEHAYVEENTLKEGAAPEHAENPAAVLEVHGNISGADSSAQPKIEKHTVFANFPDFPTVHGRPTSELGLTVQYRRPRSGSRGESHELRFVPDASGVQYQIQTGTKIEQGRVEIGKEISTGWMNLQFRVDQVLPHAVPDVTVTPLDDDDKSELAVSAAELEIKSGKTAQKFWIVEGLHKSLMFEEGLFEIVFGRRQLALGFELMLKDFRVKNDPGTERPASFESDVVLKDFSRGTSFEKTISMNQPLVYKGFQIYQAGYTPNPEGKEMSSFAVGRDPGVPLKYLGAIIMVIGILLMFYTRAYSTRSEKDFQ